MKFQRKNIFYVVISLFILKIVYNQLFTEDHKNSNEYTFWRRKVIIQNDLLDYKEDGLRSGWPFKITKQYLYDLQPYTSKSKIVSTGLPGDEGDRNDIFCAYKSSMKNTSCIFCSYLILKMLIDVFLVLDFFIGLPVIISPFLIGMAQHAYAEYQVNILASNKVARNRSLPDYRNPRCLDIKYPTLLPTVSIVMTFHNEALSILQRAIESALSRSPDNLLQELILVDDFSEKDFLKEPLEKYLNAVSNKVKLIRTDKRQGVIRARMIGAEKAKVI